MNYLPGLALNHDPPDLRLLSSWDYRRKPPAPAENIFVGGSRCGKGLWDSGICSNCMEPSKPLYDSGLCMCHPRFAEMVLTTLLQKNPHPVERLLVTPVG
jgi:hypothetical protein